MVATATVIMVPAELSCWVVVVLQVLSASCEKRSISVDPIPVFVEESGIEEVEKFETVIIFYIDLQTESDEVLNVTVAPKVCCLDIAPLDSECGGVIELRPPANVVFGSTTLTVHVQFMFRNLYVRYRRGNCSFSIYSKGEVPWKFNHTIQFDTYPKVFENNEKVACLGVDLDPDRGCSPVDCAIKYQGVRNYYRNSTMKCEKVVECDTRGHDGVSTVAYYDWENNMCHPLSYALDDSVEIKESDVLIPAELDPSQNTIFPDFEPEHIKKMMDTGQYKLNCNNGVQKGMICECWDGWMSSGVQQSSLLDFNWCDRKMVDKATIQLQPRRLSKPVEILIIVWLTVCNVVLLTIWIFLAYRIILSALMIRKSGTKKMQEKSGSKKGYTLLKQHRERQRKT